MDKEAMIREMRMNGWDTYLTIDDSYEDIREEYEIYQGSDDRYID